MIARNLAGFRFTRLILLATLAFGLASASASAGVLLASDSYAIGSNPSAGQYVAYDGASAGGLYSGQSPSLANLGFNNGGYAGGNGTSQWVASSTGLVNAADGADSSTGSVEFLGGVGVKNVARGMNLGSGFVEGTTGGNNTYFMSMLVSNSGASTATDGSVFAGIGTTSFVAPTLGNTSGNLFGLFVGFSDDSGTAGESDLVIRSRDSSATPATAADTTLVSNTTANQTYLVVMEINLRPTSAVSPITYWVNPTDLSSTAAMTSTASATSSFNSYAFQGSASGNADFQRMNYYANDYYNGNQDVANFDEIRLGSSLASIAPATVPEPASIALTALGFGGFALGSFWRRRRSSR